MYQISVPLINISARRMGKEKLIDDLKALNAGRVFLALGPYHLEANDRRDEMTALKGNTAYFKEQGFEVGVWFWTFMITAECDFTYMESPFGISKTEVCPGDENFRAFAAAYVKEIAECDPDLIMFDDDFRYGFLDDGLGCTCKHHRAFMEKELGFIPTQDELINHIYAGGKNKIRDAWLKGNGYYFKMFAKEMRAAVDSVNPDIRFGLCSCMDLWDFDGVSTAEISKILAGNTKPFLRLIGAPYWAVNRSYGNGRLQNIIEWERMERRWCGEGIEIMSEGDVYPRPRNHTPAAYAELFDMALRADATLDGILKYGIDYTSRPGYETGYKEFHQKNRAIYEAIEKHFTDKTSCGVRVYERMTKFADMEVPEEVAGTSDVQNLFFSMASKMLSDNTIPTVYEGLGVAGIAYAENVEIVPEEAFRNGMILDLRAAEILKSKGIDVGLIKKGEKLNFGREYFESVRDEVSGIAGGTYYDVTISERAEVRSYCPVKQKDKSIVKKPISYRYQNDKGQKFLVFAFNGYCNDEEYINRSYARSLELKETITDFFGHQLPAYSYGNPDLYIQTKKNDAGHLSVALFNIFEDSILHPVAELDKEYSEIEFINCTGELKGDQVCLSEIAPYAFAGFTVK